MGGRQSKKAGEEGVEDNGERTVKGQEEYAWWTLESIQRSWRRAKKLGLTTVNRNEFLTVFTDLTVIRQSKFLALPLEIFEYFIAEEDRDVPPHAQRVVVREVLAVLGLFCSGSPTAQLRFSFQLFDDDNSKSMTIDEMIKFFEVMCVACVKVGLLTTVPPHADLARVAASSFRTADINSDGDISTREFIAWARKHVLTRKLLDEFKTAKKSAAKHVNRKQLVSLRKKKLLMKKKRRINAKRLKVLNDSMTAARELINRIATANNSFGIDEIRRLREAFTTVAGDKNSALNRNQFVTTLGRAFPLLMGEKPVLRTLFDAFDSDNSGDIDFKEFMLGLAKLIQANLSDKMQMVFEVLDRAGKGYATISDLLDVVKEGSQELMEIASITEDTIAELDKDGDGTVSLAEFREVLTEKPVLFECFFGKSTNKHLDDLKPKFSHKRGCSAYGLRTLWDQYKHHKRKYMNIVRFRKMMSDNFDCGTREYQPIVNKIFRIVDTQRDGMVPYAEVFFALSQLFPTTTEDMAELYFTMYDADGSGEMDKDELLHMVLSSREAMDKNAAQAAQLLLKMDLDGDGVVTWEEFQSAYTTNPQLIRVFAKLFGVDNAVDPAKEKYMSGPVFTITKAIASEQAAAFETARKYGGLNTDDEFRQDALHHKRGYKWLRRKQEEDNSAGLTLMRRASISTAGNIVTAMQMVQQERDQELEDGYAVKDPLVTREQQIATSVAAREFGSMLRGMVKTESFRISQDIKLLKQRTARLLDTGITRGGSSRSIHTARDGGSTSRGSPRKSQTARGKSRQAKRGGGDDGSGSGSGSGSGRGSPAVGSAVPPHVARLALGESSRSVASSVGSDGVDSSRQSPFSDRSGAQRNALGVTVITEVADGYIGESPIARPVSKVQVITDAHQREVAAATVLSPEVAASNAGPSLASSAGPATTPPHNPAFDRLVSPVTTLIEEREQHRREYREQRRRTEEHRRRSQAEQRRQELAAFGGDAVADSDDDLAQYMPPRAGAAPVVTGVVPSSPTAKPSSHRRRRSSRGGKTAVVAGSGAHAHDAGGGGGGDGGDTTTAGDAEAAKPAEPRELRLNTQPHPATGRPRRLSMEVMDSVHVLERLKGTQQEAMRVVTGAPDALAVTAAPHHDETGHAAAVVAAVMSGQEGGFPSARHFNVSGRRESRSGRRRSSSGGLPHIGRRGSDASTGSAAAAGVQDITAWGAGDGSEYLAASPKRHDDGQGVAAEGSPSGDESRSKSPQRRRRRGPQYNLRYVRVNHRTASLERMSSSKSTPNLAHSPLRTMHRKPRRSRTGKRGRGRRGLDQLNASTMFSVGDDGVGLAEESRVLPMPTPTAAWNRSLPASGAASPPGHAHVVSGDSGAGRHVQRASVGPESDVDDSGRGGEAAAATSGAGVASDGRGAPAANSLAVATSEPGASPTGVAPAVRLPQLSPTRMNTGPIIPGADPEGNYDAPADVPPAVGDMMAAHERDHARGGGAGQGGHGHSTLQSMASPSRRSVASSVWTPAHSRTRARRGLGTTVSRFSATRSRLERRPGASDLFYPLPVTPDLRPFGRVQVPAPKLREEKWQSPFLRRVMGT